jgi:hypothetical protein
VERPLHKPNAVPRAGDMNALKNSVSSRHADERLVQGAERHLKDGAPE